MIRGRSNSEFFEFPFNGRGADLTSRRSTQSRLPPAASARWSLKRGRDKPGKMLRDYYQQRGWNEKGSFFVDGGIIKKVRAQNEKRQKKISHGYTGASLVFLPKIC
jgi:hypothetical protein